MSKQEWFPHIYTASSSGNLDTAKILGGAEAVGLYWIIVEELYQKHGDPIPRKILQAKSIALRCKDETLTLLIENDVLQETENGVFSERVKKEIIERETHLEELSIKRAEAGKKGSEKRWGQKENSNEPEEGNNGKPIANATESIANATKKIAKNSKAWQTIAKDSHNKHIDILEEPHNSNTYKPSCLPSNNNTGICSIVGGELSSKGSLPDIPEEQVFITIPLNDGTEYPISKDKVKEFQELYQAIDVEQKLRNIKGWCISNPKQRKTKAGVMRFINSWLSKDNDRAPAYGGGGQPVNGRILGNGKRVAGAYKDDMYNGHTGGTGSIADLIGGNN